MRINNFPPISRSSAGGADPIPIEDVLGFDNRLPIGERSHRLPDNVAITRCTNSNNGDESLIISFARRHQFVKDKNIRNEESIYALTKYMYVLIYFLLCNNQINFSC